MKKQEVSEPNREMRFRGPGAQREGERHRKDSYRNNICSCLRVSARLVRGIWEKCIFIAYNNFMNTKECHRRSQRTRHKRPGNGCWWSPGKVAAPLTLPSPISSAVKCCWGLSERRCTATPTGTCHLTSVPVTFTAACHNSKVKNTQGRSL